MQSHWRAVNTPDEDALPARLQNSIVISNRMRGSYLKKKKKGTHRFLSRNLMIPRVVSPPTEFLVAEKAMSSVTYYCTASFESGSWTYDHSETLINASQQDHTGQSLIFHFYDYCRMATQLIWQGSFAQGIQILSKGLSLVPDMLKNENPRTLESIFKTSLHMRKRGRHELHAIVEQHISEMARVLLPSSHPLVWLCEAVARGSPQHEEMIIQAWKCISDIFERSLGAFSPAAVMCHNNCIRAAYEPRDPGRAEANLRSRLSLIADEVGDHSLAFLATSLQLVYNLIAQGEYLQAETEAERLLEISHDAGDFQLDYEGKALEVTASIQYLLGARSDAEDNLRRSISIYALLRGDADSVVVNLKMRLEIWLRDRGQVEDADELGDEISKWISSSARDAGQIMQ